MKHMVKKWVWYMQQKCTLVNFSFGGVAPLASKFSICSDEVGYFPRAQAGYYPLLLGGKNTTCMS